MLSESIWTDIALPAFPTLEQDKDCDVLIIGGGMCGLLCAHYLKEAGADCIVCEAGRIANQTTIRTTASLSMGQDTLYSDIARSPSHGIGDAGLYMRANRAALDEYKKLCTSIDCDFEERDLLFEIPDTKKFKRECKTLLEIGADVSPIAGRQILRYPKQAQFHPMKLLAGIVPGLTIYENTRILHIDGTTATTGKHRIHAKKIIVATHFPLQKWKGLFFLKLYQKRAYVLALEGISDPGYHYYNVDTDGVSIRMQGRFLLLCGGDHRTGKEGGGFDRLMDYRADHFPRSIVYRSWATQDTQSLDGLPYIGQITRSDSDNFVAAGFGGWGMTGSMHAALILRELVQGRSHELAALFDPSRSMLTGQLALNAGETLLTFLNPIPRRCTHMGCALRWNPRECSWDCACHGSRFDKAGGILNNPAQHGFKM